MRFLHFILILGYNLFLFSQKVETDYIYKHINSDNGLISPGVYSVSQDSEGFLWFSTSIGLARYDGENFKYYGPKEGLEDNYAFGAFEDHEGVMWFRSFAPKIYHVENDSVIATKFSQLVNDKIIGSSFINGLKRLGKDSIIFTTSTTSEIFYHTQDTSDVLPVDSSQFLFDQKIKTTNDILKFEIYKDYLLIRRGSNSKFKPYLTNDFRASGTVLEFKPKHYLWKNQNSIYLISEDTVVKHQFSEDISIITKSPKGNILVSFSTGGVKEFELFGSRLNLVHTFLPNYGVYSTFVDKNGGYWFATVNNGVFYLTTSSSKEIVLTNEKYFSPLTMNYSKVDSSNYTILISTYYNPPYALLIQNNKIKYRSLDYKFPEPIVNTRINENDELIFNSYSNVYQLNKKNRPHKVNKEPTMPLDIEIEGFLWKYGSSMIKRIDLESNEIADTIIYGERPNTELIVENDSVWFGTRNSFYRWHNGNLTNFKDEKIKITGYITNLHFSDSHMYVLTRNDGLFIKNKGLWRHINNSNGLNGEICKYIKKDKYGNIWIATNKGFTRVKILNFKNEVYEFSYFNEDNLLLSNSISRFLFVDNKAWAGTDKGLMSFDLDNLPKTEIAIPYITNFKANDRNILNENLNLNHKENNIQLNFGFIGFSNRDNIEYRYRLVKNNKGNWIRTNSNSIVFTDLSPGTYKFELSLCDLSDCMDQVETLSFTIKPAFWQRIWFIALVILFITFLVFVAIRWRFNLLKKKNDLSFELNALKHAMLSSQMNPHFVFNALSSVERYIMENDKKSAIAFLSNFSRLIRNVFENSGRSFVRLGEELETVKTYLELEKRRLGDSFSYVIKEPSDLRLLNTEIPSSIVQPFVENALKHGLLLKEGEKILSITTESVKNKLVVKIRDNGIGRESSTAKTKDQNLTHRSRGMTLVRRRLQLTRELFDMDIKLIIHDLKNEKSLPIGTEVELKIELENND
jgi:ligand-binding sensor domain-containing protein